MGSTKQKYKLKMDLLKSMLGNECRRCKSTKDLEFDHIDPETKSFTIANRWNDDLETLKDELDKCQLLCFDCHVSKSRSDYNDRVTSGKLVVKPFTHGSSYAWMRLKCLCDICLEAKKQSNSIRSKGKRNSYNVDVVHGSARSYYRGCRCDDCKLANTIKERFRLAGVLLSSVDRIVDGPHHPNLSAL